MKAPRTSIQLKLIREWTAVLGRERGDTDWSERDRNAIEQAYFIVSAVMDRKRDAEES